MVGMSWQYHVMCGLQMLELAGPGRVFTVKVQSQAQNVILVALKPDAREPAVSYSGRDIRQVMLLNASHHALYTSGMLSS